MTDGEDLAGAFGSHHHVLRFRDVHRHRLLAQHVQAGVERRHRCIAVHERGRAYRDRVKLGEGQQLTVVGIPMCQVKALGKGFGPFGSHIAASHQLTVVGERLVPRRMCSLGDTTAADDAHPQLICHRGRSFGPGIAQSRCEPTYRHHHGQPRRLQAQVPSRRREASSSAALCRPGGMLTLREQRIPTCTVALA